MEIVLIRHGETTWSAEGRHTSYTDIDLTIDGEQEALDLAPRLAGRVFAAVLASPRKRALRTAELAGLSPVTVDDDLTEWDYGEYEGVTTAEIHRNRPDWYLWRDGCPGGETPAQVAARLDRILDRASSAGGDTALVGHGHALRMAGARWIGLDPAGGGLLRLDTGTLSRLGYERDRPVILSWNA